MAPSGTAALQAAAIASATASASVAGAAALAQSSPNYLYRQKRDWERPTVLSRYSILGFLSSGTYGRVYKARIRKHSSDSSPAGLIGTPSANTPGKKLKLAKDDGNDDEGELVAIKKFKPDKEGEAVTYTGISQSACREIMINREISHEHVTALREVMLEEKSIYLVFEYAEHDFLQIIHHHSSTRTGIPTLVLKSLLWQLTNGVSYLHDNWIIHRDLKPANILVTSSGQVKIGDLGLARLYQEPLQPLYTSDKIVVTVWYRSPELLLGARHYTPSIDLWSLGCIFGELLALRPMFKGEEAKVEIGAGKKGGVPFQKDQMTRVIEVLGSIERQQWPTVTHLPEYSQLARLDRDTLEQWLSARIVRGGPIPDQQAFNLLRNFLIYDPSKRITARQALVHAWWGVQPIPCANAFIGLPPGVSYPMRRVTHDESDPKLSSQGVQKTAPFVGGNSTGVGSAAALQQQQQQQQQQRVGKRSRLDA
ncbi:BZ3500_MvSof-1268-A1-R1_Chr2-3g05349 [Microbotryum saponariae]|uniref:Cyclin-dependent kinase 8 n=1 Tax=Microbotryum saponariae TaxID=289078 RepID=A0A2X0KP78_9BASI|nr:BZ3500_MvSof-1268-A1-R1_Chr2-3g05349 [Microbotryum saponariae]SDA01249.1 BZ3501_MvSof-1269-A2-R1_Chr2-2g05022 [Microbotryum saponariae]